MPEPSIPEILRTSFSALPDPPYFWLNWPEDAEEQARCIRLLRDMVSNKALPFPERAWAFDKLELIAREDVYGWGLRGKAREAFRDFTAAAFVGQTPRPKRGKGERVRGNRLRDVLIARAVAWLVFDREYGEADAIETVRQALPRAGGGNLTTERIKDVLAERGPIEKYRNQLAAFDSV